MQATGFQILFLIFVVQFASMLLSRWAEGVLALSPIQSDHLLQALPFLFAILLLGGIPALRRRAAEMLANPVPKGFGREIAVATGLNLAIPFGLVGATALTAFALNDAGVLARIPIHPDPDGRMASSVAPLTLAFTVIISWLLGPILEEIFFRGFLYQAWEKQWGWMPATLLTSIAFGLGHPTHLMSSFLASVVFISIMRRGNSLRAAIYVHSAYNILVFWPLFGHRIFSVRAGDQTDWTTWSVEIACFAVILVAIPAYLFLARRPCEPPRPGP